MSENASIKQQQSDGVDPKRAEKHHQEFLPIAVERALKGTNIEKLKAIAVTLGPG